VGSYRKEVLRRLGHPRFRYICASCHQYVPSLDLVFVWDQGAEGQMREARACSNCAEQIRQTNKRYVEDRVRNQVQLELANIEHRSAAERPSSAEYLAACERMRREGW
jgi:hypothetical protein